MNHTEDLQKEILEELAKSENPLSTQQIAIAIDRPWHSIQTRCLMLQIDGKLKGFKVGRINLWQKT